jgi:DNA-directed RNA polymerase specialized sigma subunit
MPGPDDWLHHPGIAPPPEVRLEPAYHAPYAAWRRAPGPATAGALVTALSPTIDKAVRSYGGPKPAPALRGRAKAITLQAIRTYDPARAGLEPHVLRHLQGLQRHAARQARLLHAPDRLVQDRRRVDEGERILEEELGRAPTTAELADRLMLPPPRIALARQYRPGLAQSQVEVDPEGGGGFEAAVARGDTTAARAEFLLHDLPPADQLILEHGLGLHGRARLGTSEIATRLGISPGRVSQRAARIQAALDRLDDLGVV